LENGGRIILKWMGGGRVEVARNSDQLRDILRAMF
jgi:hypothetical protein